MKLSTRARYALRMMLELTKLHSDGPVSLGIIADQTQISRRYLDQLASAMKAADLLRSTTGKGGGYQLNRAPGEIRIGQIVEAAIGPVNIVDCVKKPQTCDRADGCECRSIYALINDRISQVLHDITLAELSEPEVLDHLIDGMQPRLPE